MTLTLNTGYPSILPPEPTLTEAIPVLSRLARDPDFLASRVLPLAEGAGRAEDWYVAYRHDPDRSHPVLAAAIDEYLNPEKEAFLERG